MALVTNDCNVCTVDYATFVTVVRELSVKSILVVCDFDSVRLYDQTNRLLINC